jgi:flagellin-like hook-associated protein FlgL
MSGIVLSAGVRQNLLALQTTAQQMSVTQNRLATGKKVNSALDNPINFFTAAGLQTRAGDLGALLDAMSNGVQTIQAANNGLTAMTTVVEQMQATVQQASQDSSFQSTDFTMDNTAIGHTAVKNLTFSGGNVTGSVNVALNTVDSNAALTAASKLNNGAGGSIDATGGDITFTINTHTVTLSQTAANAVTGKYTLSELETAINTQVGASAKVNATDDGAGGHLILTSTNTAGASDSVTVGNFTGSASPDASLLGYAAGASATASGADGAVNTIDQMVTAINTNGSLTGKVKAANDNGSLRITSLSTADLTVVGADATNTINGGTGPGNTQTIGGNIVRGNLVTQFNNLIGQLNSIAGDASYNGINLLVGDTLKLVFNETNTSSISITSQDPNGVNATTLGLTAATGAEFSSNTQLSSRLTQLQNGLIKLRSQSADFGSNLSLVENRQNFTKQMINTLQTGSDNLVLADTNEEGANMLALQTRQQLSITALSLSAQADQAILKIL